MHKHQSSTKEVRRVLVRPYHDYWSTHSHVESSQPSKFKENKQERENKITSPESLLPPSCSPHARLLWLQVVVLRQGVCKSDSAHGIISTQYF